MGLPRNRSIASRRESTMIALRAGCMGAVLLSAAALADFGDPLPGLTADEIAAFEDGKADFTEVETVADGLGPARELRRPGLQSAVDAQRRWRRGGKARRLHDLPRPTSAGSAELRHRPRQPRGSGHRMSRLPHADAAHRAERGEGAERSSLPPVLRLPPPRHGLPRRWDHPESRDRKADTDAAALGPALADATPPRRSRAHRRPGDSRP